MQPEKPMDDINKAPKGKQCAARAKSPPNREEKNEMQPQKPMDDTKKAAKGKQCAARAKPPPNAEEKIAMQPEKPEHKAQPQATAVDSLLKRILQNHRIRKDEKSATSKLINEIKKAIYNHLKETKYFKTVEEPLTTGSYYENLKISHPDEFDVMMPIPLVSASIEPFGEDGAFYTVSLGRATDPLHQFQENGTLSASKMLAEFRTEVLNCVKAFPEWTAEKKKKGCPAVTLTTVVQGVPISMDVIEKAPKGKRVARAKPPPNAEEKIAMQPVPISLDVVLSLRFRSSWPSFTKDGFKIEQWQGTKAKTNYKREPFYLVPKYEGNGALVKDGQLAKDTWRISFSNIEKAILKNHGKEKTCCEQGGASCCRKDCLKLLKLLLQSLKEEDTSLKGFCSYHAKTTLLHACCDRPDDSAWRTEDLPRCFSLLLDDFVDHLQSGKLYNFFIPGQNLLAKTSKSSRDRLVRHIREQRDNGFHIFSETKCCE